MKEHTGKNKIFIVIIICLCAVIIAGLIYFMKLKGGSDSAFKPDLDSNAKTQTADDTGEKPTGIRIPGYPSITIEADKKDVQMNLMNPEGNPCYFTFEIVLNDTDGKTVAAVDCLVPGIGEIIGGSQREDDYEKLATRMEELGMKTEDYGFYMDLRKYGSTRHAGFGLGFERCIMYLTGMGNIRDVVPFPRTVNNCEL